MRRRFAIPVGLTAVLLAAGTTAVWTAVSSPATDTPGAVGDPSTTVAETPGPVKPVNEVVNPGAELGWSVAASTAGTILVRDETRAHTGTAAFKMVTGSAGGDVVMDDTPNWVGASTGPTCSAGAWVAGPIGATVQIGLTESSAAGVVGSVQTPITLADTDWHLVEATLAVTPGNQVDLRISGIGLAPGAELWVDDVTENCGRVVPLHPPVAVLTITPTTGLAPLLVTADASGSTDPDADIASYGVDWGDGGPVGSGPTATHTYNSAGTYTVTATVTDAAGLTGTASQSIVVTSPPPALDPVVVAAGDSSCVGGTISSGCGAVRTARIIAKIAPTRVLPLGDLQYGGTRTATEFQAGYGPFPDPTAHPSWGDFKSITSPTIGSHEYDVYATADGYFAYWNGSATADGPAGKPTEGFYAEDIGTWRVIHLNTQKGYKTSDPQYAWFTAELAAHAKQCTLVTWHHPRFSSGVHGNQTRTDALFAAAYAGGADALLSGNDHLYERFDPQNPSAAADSARGIRQFVVGSGGKGLYSWGTIKPNSAFRQNTTFGVLSLTLHDGSYDWAYVAVDGTTLDSGNAACHA